MGSSCVYGCPLRAEESGEPKHVAVISGADDHRPAGSRFEEADATQYERAHDALAQLGLRHQNLTQLRGRDDERVDILRRAGVHQ